MDVDQKSDRPSAMTASHTPATAGADAENVRYMQAGARPAEPSVINTNSKFLNNAYYRDAYAQFALRRNGPDLPSTYIIPMAAKAIGEVTDFAEFQRLLDAEKAKNPEFGEWLRARRITIFRREDLAASAPGTLGHAIWELLGIPGIEMDLQLKGIDATNDVDYISKRRGLTHDIEHIVTGFNANNAGELANVWQSIASCARYFTPQLAHHITSGITMLGTASIQQCSLHYPAAFPTYMEALRLGIAMGEALRRPLLLEPWEDMLDWPLEDIRAHLGITPGPGAAWDWTNAATTG